ncbi:hypothetical protein ABZ783_24965 [Micromonospora sp. NPDC047738]|uniref:hypothetical protein n=1 Tax=Micromonospora sp. NPDC047738 TaxID=3155741 RepID=UPI0033E2D04A
MKDFIGRFWALVVSLAGLVGLYLGAVAVKLTWAFWAVVAVAVAAAAVPGVRQWLSDTRTALRDHPALKAEIASLGEQVASLTEQLAAARESAEDQYAAGLVEGSARILATALSSYTIPPRIVGIAHRHGSITLVARFDDPEPDRRVRFTVVASGTGEVKGAVRVQEIDRSRKRIYLECVEATSQQFWAHLEQRAAYDSTAPKGTELVRYIHTGKKLILDDVVATEAVETVQAEAEK